MFYQAFKKESFTRWITYLSLFCLFFTSQAPPKLHAQTYVCPEPSYAEPSSEPISCVLFDREASHRTKVAMVVAGATVVALLGIGAYAIFSHSSCHKHHSHCSSSSYSNYSCHNHSRHGSSENCNYHDHRSSPWYSDYSPSCYYYSNPYSIFSENNVSHFTGESGVRDANPQILERGDAMLRGKHLVRSKVSKEAHELSGAFILHPTPGFHHGSASAYVRFPDGNTQTLGSASFSSSKGSSIPYGPFTKKGTYTFGINVDGATSFSSQAKIGSIEVNINDSTVESHDFYVPAHSPSHYEPHPHEYTL